MRTYFQNGSATVAREQRSNFTPYSTGSKKQATGRKAKAQSWTMKMVCLARTTDDRVPSTVAAREILVEAGLGEKKVTFFNLMTQGYAFFSALQ